MFYATTTRPFEKSSPSLYKPWWRAWRKLHIKGKATCLTKYFHFVLWHIRISKLQKMLLGRRRIQISIVEAHNTHE